MSVGILYQKLRRGNSGDIGVGEAEWGNLANYLRLELGAVVCFQSFTVISNIWPLIRKLRSSTDERVNFCALQCVARAGGRSSTPVRSGAGGFIAGDDGAGFRASREF
jgi:hypothetical protein